MNNYLLSIDPSIKNTGFTLWEKRCHILDCENDDCNELLEDKWVPIWVNSYNFTKNINFKKWINYEFNNIYTEGEGYIDLIIERGIFNPKFGKGKETLDHLRGFISGKFNKLLTKDMLISPKLWQCWYMNILKNNNYFNLKWISNKWEKEYSLILTEWLIIKNNWNIKISNHDEADSLLIGWYYLNKENK